MGRFDSLTQLTKPPARPVPPAERSPQPAQTSSTTPVDTSRPSAPVTAASPTITRRRDKIRHPFEIYQDQLDTLRERAYHERREGKTGSMSQMVREALDRYLSKTPSADD